MNLNQEVFDLLIECVKVSKTPDPAFIDEASAVFDKKPSRRAGFLRKLAKKWKLDPSNLPTPKPRAKRVTTLVNKNLNWPEYCKMCKGPCKVRYP